ncbi:MAG: class I SAM-dependent methyltransferase [Candidatus Dormiibacterota bacterium]
MRLYSGLRSKYGASLRPGADDEDLAREFGATVTRYDAAAPCRGSTAFPNRRTAFVASLKETSSDWEYMAQTDPLWAVCTELGPQGGSYEELARFWQSGQRDIQAAVSHVEACGLRIDRDGEALDFGCGLGRVSQPLSEVFARCTGVDISPKMLELARGFNPSPDRLTFTLNERADLSIFADGRFACVYSTRVLQHIPRRYALAYVGELVRVLARDRGILVFHAHEVAGGPMFSALSALQRMRQRSTRLRVRLEKAYAGFNDREGPPLPPRMHMFPLPQALLRPVIEAHGGRILDVAPMGFDPMRIRPVLQPIADRWHCGLQPVEYVVVKRA